jgi:hypothetical protein
MMKIPPSRESFPFVTEFYPVSGIHVAMWPGGSMAEAFNDDGGRGFSVPTAHSAGGDPMSCDDWIARFWNLSRTSSKVPANPARPRFKEPSSFND